MAEAWTIWDAELGYGPMSFLKGDKSKSAAQGAEPAWGVANVRPDGVAIMHMFPHSTMEWRCAEYGIDPEDVETLLDVILHEPFIPSDNDMLALLDPAASQVLRDTKGFPTCWTPDVPDTDRLQAHLARIESVKRHLVSLENAPKADRQAALVYVGSRRAAPADPLAPIKSATRLDPVRVNSRKLAVDWHRASSDRFVRPSFDAKPASTFTGMQPPVS